MPTGFPFCDCGALMFMRLERIQYDYAVQEKSIQIGYNLHTLETCLTKRLPSATWRRCQSGFVSRRGKRAPKLHATWASRGLLSSTQRIFQKKASLNCASGSLKSIRR